MCIFTSTNSIVVEGAISALRSEASALAGSDEDCHVVNDVLMTPHMPVIRVFIQASLHWISAKSVHIPYDITMNDMKISTLHNIPS